MALSPDHLLLVFFCAPSDVSYVHSVLVNSCHLWHFTLSFHYMFLVVLILEFVSIFNLCMYLFIRRSVYLSVYLCCRQLLDLSLVILVHHEDFGSSRYLRPAPLLMLRTIPRLRGWRRRDGKQ